MKVLVFLLLIVCMGCAQNLQIVWEPNPLEENIEFYKVYVSETFDTTGWDSTMMDSVGVVAHNPLIIAPNMYDFQYSFQEDMVIRAGLVAVDSLTRASDMSLSRFYDRPSENITIKIIK